MKKRLVQTPWFYWLVLVIALELIAISVNFFYAPINIAAGGATGPVSYTHLTLPTIGG